MRCHEGVSHEPQSAFPSRRSAPNGFLAAVRVGCRLPKVAIKSITVSKSGKGRRIFGTVFQCLMTTVGFAEGYYIRASAVPVTPMRLRQRTPYLKR